MERFRPVVTAEVPTDADLIERSRSEPDCFAGIFDRHAAEIRRYAHARLGPDLAGDVTAETFLAAFRRRDSYDTSRGDARPWLYGIAIRLIGKHRRADSRYRRLLRAVPADRLTDDLSDRSAERVTAGQLRPRLAAVPDGLPARDRELLPLIAWAGLIQACHYPGNGRRAPHGAQLVNPIAIISVMGNDRPPVCGPPPTGSNTPGHAAGLRQPARRRAR